MNDRTLERTGMQRDGKYTGHWILRFASGNVAEDPYVDNEQHGDLVFRYADGSIEDVQYAIGDLDCHHYHHQPFARLKTVPLDYTDEH